MNHTLASLDRVFCCFLSSLVPLHFTLDTFASLTITLIQSIEWATLQSVSFLLYCCLFSSISLDSRILRAPSTPLLLTIRPERLFFHETTSRQLQPLWPRVPVDSCCRMNRGTERWSTRCHRLRGNIIVKLTQQLICLSLSLVNSGVFTSDGTVQQELTQEQIQPEPPQQSDP